MCVMDFMPFTYHRTSERDYRVDIKSIIQALIIASVTAVASMYGTQLVIGEKLSAIESDISDIKHNQREFRKDFYSPRH